MTARRARGNGHRMKRFNIAHVCGRIRLPLAQAIIGALLGVIFLSFFTVSSAVFGAAILKEPLTNLVLIFIAAIGWAAHTVLTEK